MGKRFLAVTLGVAFLCLGLMAQAQDVYMWEFNEGEGTTVTDNSGQYDSILGALLDMPVSEEDSPSGQAGDRSVTPVGGFEVDDSENPVLDVVEGPLTFEVWINPNELTGNQDFFRIGNSLKAGTSGDTMLFTFLGVVDIGTGVVIPVDGNWHHLAYAWEPGVGVTYYLDGAEAEFVEETRAPRAFENQMLSIGSSHEGGSVFNGKMDRLRLHEAVLDASQLDSDAANPKDLLDTTLVAYDFDETEWPYANSTDADRPATSINQRELENSYPEFSPLSPTGEEGDFSMQFDGNDRITYDDNETFFFDIIDEPFTFETWLKFNSEDQIAGRPVFLAYGRGGQGGYSFSFRPAPEQAETVEDAPSGQAGDHSIRPNSVLEISNENHPLLSLREGPMTVEAWVKPDAFPTWSDIIRIGLSLKAGFHDANLVFTLFGIADINTEVAVPVDEGWHHVAYAWEPGVGVSFYLDGQMAQFVERADTAGREFQNDVIQIGGASTFDGLIDRVRVHGAVLDESQLDSDAANPQSPLADTLIAYNFDEMQPPYKNSINNDLPMTSPGNYLTVTTFGIVDAHSQAEIPDDGLWHHVAAVFDWDGFAFNFYVDGELSDTYPYEDGVIPTPAGEAYLMFGSERGGGLPFVGLMDRVRITRDALTADQLDYFEPAPVETWHLY